LLGKRSLDIDHIPKQVSRYDAFKIACGERELQGIRDHPSYRFCPRLVSADSQHLRGEIRPDNLRRSILEGGVDCQVTGPCANI
jgi:hypothetical protein